MNVIGLGGAGCKIAKQFENFPQYNVFFIDTDNKNDEKNFIKVKEQKTHEEYELNYKQINTKKIKGEATVIFAGSGKISGTILRLLEQLKNRKLNVLYIKPDMSTAPPEAIVRERVTFGVLQQYTRSNLISNLYIVSNAAVEQVLDSVSISSYWHDINTVITSTYNMLNVFANTEPVLNTLSNPGVTSKIATVGVVGYKSLEEKLFYNLQKPRLKKYFFGISEKTLNEEKDLLHKIRNYIASRTEDKCTACFAIYSTNYEQDYVYTTHYASLIQEEEK